MAKKKENDNSTVQQRNFGAEIWGLLFMGLGFMVFIALISYLICDSENVLGPLLGTAMSRGLVKFFGPIAAFGLPLTVIMVGLQVFRGVRLVFRPTLFILVFSIEFCTLLAVHNITVIRDMEAVSSNLLGNGIVYQLHRVFGPHPFGPYFLLSLAILITLAIWFNINLRDLFFTAYEWTRRKAGAVLDSSRLTMQRLFTPSPKPATQTASGSNATAPPKESRDSAVTKGNQTGKDKKKEKKERIESKKAPSDNAFSPEGSSTKPVDTELAAFRARQNEPIKISTDEAVVVEEEIEDSDDEGDIAEGGLVDPSLLDGDGEEEEILEKIPSEQREQEKPKKKSKPYEIPSPDIIPDPIQISNQIDRDELEQNSRTLEKTLMNFGVEGKVVNVCPGPIVTRYEIELAPGVKISKVVNLTDDLSLAVGGKKIRIEAPIPGKAAVGIELPNREMQVVHFKHVLVSEAYQKTKSKLPVVVGRNVSGTPFFTDIRKMPHLLIAGQTGAGKSVCINSLICSLLMTKTPEELRLIMIDPKKVELSYYEGIPHLMSPVVTESKEAVRALQWGVQEMMRRYRLLAKVHARNIDSFNEKAEGKTIPEGIIPDIDYAPLPFIVILVDELADLMMTASKDVEGLIQRIAQLARAVGIHLIVATQRPSVDIITGPIKANLTSRIAFRTIQSTDSRTILGHVGAEKLLGRGDMLFLRNGAPDIERFHGAFISEQDMETIVDSIRNQNVEVDRIESFGEATGDTSESETIDGGGSFGDDGDRDDRFEEAARLIVTIGQGSTSLLQRRLKLGYARAGRLMDELHDAGIVGPQEGSKMRDVLLKPDELEEHLARL